MRTIAFDLIVLDVMMPGEDGFSFATRVRGEASTFAQVPILMLTAKTEFEERVLGFEIGVDDYLGQAVRAARAVRCASPRSCAVPSRRRIGRADAGAASAPSASTWSAANCARRRDRPHHASASARCCGCSPPAGATVSREALSGAGGAGNERTIDVQVNRLRRKIERDPANPLHLQTVRGVGYRLLVDR